MEQNPIIDLFGNCYDSQVVSLLPLENIPVEYEADEDRTHDGIHPCGDPDCPCALYGYGVPSLHAPWEPIR
jgi:hypothetical protein